MLLVLLVVFNSCKKSKTAAPDVKDKFIGNWAGAWQFIAIGVPYHYSLQITSNNTLTIIDSAFGNQPFPGTYRYTADSLIINYNNGTRWDMKFTGNYTGCSGNVLGFSGAAGTVSMTKK